MACSDREDILSEGKYAFYSTNAYFAIDSILRTESS